MNLQITQLSPSCSSMEVNSSCALCSDTFAPNSLTPEEFTQIQNVLGSLVPDVAGVLEESSPDQSAFCRDCHVLLKEANRLHLLLQTINVQLNSVLHSIKSKVVERSLEVKQEEEEVVEVKEEYDVNYELPEINHTPIPEDLPNIPNHTNASSQSFRTRRKSKLIPLVDIFTEESNLSEVKEEPDDEELISSEFDPSNSTSLPETQDDSQSQDSPKTKTSKRKRPATSDDVPSTSKSNRIRNKHSICHFCSLRFKSKEDKLLHDEAVHFKGAFEDVEGKCRLFSRICGKASLTPAELSRHNEICHEAFLKFLCLSCHPHRKFTTLDLLKAHQPIHDDSLTSFPCSLCLTNPLTFDTPLELDNHILRVHNHSVKPGWKVQLNRAGPECDNPPRVGQKQPQTCRWCGVNPGIGLFRLRTHERKTHPEQFTFICTHEECQSTFAEESHRLTCQETHRDPPGPFNCFVCNLTCPTGSDLKEHLASKHTAGGLNCPTCPDLPLLSSKRFSDVVRLRVHTARRHGGEWPHKCPLCSKGYESQSEVKDHLRASHKDNQQYLPELFECGDCGKKFARFSSLRNHKRVVHEGINNNFACEDCGKVLRSPKSLDLHMKSHKGIKDHVCHVCGKAFVNPIVLTIHLRVHTGEKPFVCHICSKAFAQTTPMYKHFAQHKKHGTWKEKPNPTQQPPI